MLQTPSPAHTQSCHDTRHTHSLTTVTLLPCYLFGYICILSDVRNVGISACHSVLVDKSRRFCKMFMIDNYDSFQNTRCSDFLELETHAQYVNYLSLSLSFRKSLIDVVKSLSVLRKVKEMTSLLFSLRWDINKAVAHECGRGHLKLVSARKRIGQAGATERSPPPPPPPRGDRTRHAAARRRRSESHPFTRQLTVDMPIIYIHFVCKLFN